MAGESADLVLHEGVPDWLRGPLRSWLQFMMKKETVRGRIFARFDHVPFDDEYEWGLGYLETVNTLSRNDLLDWVDAALHVGASQNDLGTHHYNARDLRVLLGDARSVWTVSAAQDALELSQDPTVTEAANQAATTAIVAHRDSAASRLQAAWKAAYALHADPSKAYGQAVLAVEAAAIPVVVPNQAGATLGHVLGQLDRQGHLYEVAIIDKSGTASSVTATTELVRLLWEGHTDRHEGVTPAPAISAEAAQMAVHLAATLVQWFTSGAIRRK